MKLYEIGYWSHEESPSFLFTNETNYTQEQFNQVIIDIVKNSKQQVGKDEFLKITFENILKDIVEELKVKYKFTIIKAEVSFVPFGWSNLTNTKGWEWEIGNDDINVLIKALKNEK